LRLCSEPNGASRASLRGRRTTIRWSDAGRSVRASKHLESRPKAVVLTDLDAEPRAVGESEVKPTAIRFGGHLRQLDDRKVACGDAGHIVGEPRLGLKADPLGKEK